MKVLLIGSGGREHAIAWKLSQSKKLTKLYCAPGNPGTAQYGENVDIADTDVQALVTFAQGADIGLAIIGPEDPLAAGAVDAFEAVGIKAFGPSAKAAQLEADKAFAKEIMRANSI
ncbi:MAG: phosphoribosylamine--glycine ligase, partial [Planctomycetota bacterium]